MSGILERIEGKVDQILRILGAVPVVPPVVPVDPPPVEPPVTGGSDVTINGMGTAQPVYVPATIRTTNIGPGSTMTIVKMPIVVAGLFTLTENGVPVGFDGHGPTYDIPPGNHTYVLTAELPNMVVSVQVR